MVGFVVRLGIGALGLWLAAELVPGVRIEGARALLLAALLLGIVNGIVRPVIVFLTLPFTILTLGLFLVVINGAMLGLVALAMDDFSIQGFGSALLGSLIVSITSWLAARYVGSSGRINVIVVRRD